MGEEPNNIGKNFLQQLDNYIKLNLKIMTCQDMYNIYEEFFYNLKEFHSNSSGFTGLYEFLVFRFVFHALGGKFECKQYTDDTTKFISTADERLMIGQGIRMNVKGESKYPDILIEYDGKPFSVIEIKTVTISSKTIIEVLERFNDYRTAYPELYALLMIFWYVKKDDTCVKKLTNSHARNNLLILDKNDNLLIEQLDKYLGFHNFTEEKTSKKSILRHKT